MQYLWINPVSAGMCEEDSLKRFLERHGLTRVECRGDWGRIVRERYEASLRAGVTHADARCPEAVRLLEEIQKEPENESGLENLKVAPIEPILLHCARELSTRPDLADGEKIITTPCQSLAVLGNSLGLENTRFIAWNRLARHYRCGDGGGVHRAWTYDFICTADVADRQGDRGDSGDRGSRICDGPPVWMDDRICAERIRGKWLELN